MRKVVRTGPRVATMGLILGGALLSVSTVALADADDAAGPGYGPGMMWQSGVAGPATSVHANQPEDYGPRMMWGGGYGRGGYGYGPGMMWGGGYGRGGYGYGPGMMWGGGYGRGGYGYGPGMMWGGGYGRGGYGYGPGMMFGGGYGPGMMWGGWAFANADLKLTSQQRQQLDSLRTKAWQKGWTLMGQMREEHFALLRLMTTPNPDRKAVDAAYAKLTATGKQLLDLRLETRQSALGVLTAEQRKQLGQPEGAPSTP